jgi:hypothetical protein
VLTYPPGELSSLWVRGRSYTMRLEQLPQWAVLAVWLPSIDAIV